MDQNFELGENLVKLSDIMSDPGNQLFGLPLSTIQMLIYEAQARGEDPYKAVPQPDGNSDDLNEDENDRTSR